MTIAKSTNRRNSVLLFILIYVACLAIVFFVRPVWQFTEKLSCYIDDILNATGVAMADGEFDPAGLWVIFGIPLILSIAIFFIIRIVKKRYK